MLTLRLSTGFLIAIVSPPWSLGVLTTWAVLCWCWSSTGTGFQWSLPRCSNCPSCNTCKWHACWDAPEESPASGLWGLPSERQSVWLVVLQGKHVAAFPWKAGAVRPSELTPATWAVAALRATSCHCGTGESLGLWPMPTAQGGHDGLSGCGELSC